MADSFDKIRINPGNFADGRKSFKEITYETPEDYQVCLAAKRDLHTGQKRPAYRAKETYVVAKRDLHTGQKRPI